MPEYHFATWEQHNFIDEETGAPEDFEVNQFFSSIEDDAPQTLEEVVEGLVKPGLDINPLGATGEESIVLVIAPNKKSVQRTLAQFFGTSPRGLHPDLAEDPEDEA